VTATSAANNTDSKVITALCTGGRRAIGGGAMIANGGNAVMLTSSAPALSGASPVGWVATAAGAVAYSANWSLQAYAICAFVEP
jgi:hypothetical protein